MSMARNLPQSCAFSCFKLKKRLAFVWSVFIFVRVFHINPPERSPHIKPGQPLLRARRRRSEKVGGFLKLYPPVCWKKEQEGG